MSSSVADPARGHAAGSENCDQFGDDRIPDNAVSPKTQPKSRTRARAPADLGFDPILVTNAQITADLLAESIEIAVAYGVAMLGAIRVGEFRDVIDGFRRFDEAARTAKACAVELRGILEVAAAR